MLGAPVSAGLLLLDGRGGLRGWQHLFLVLGLVTVAYALVVAVRARCIGFKSTDCCSDMLSLMGPRHAPFHEFGTQRATQVGPQTGVNGMECDLLTRPKTACGAA